MKGLTKIDKIIERVRESIDVSHSDLLYNQSLYLVGAERRSTVTSKAGELPYYPNINLTELEIGRSRRMLNAVHIVTSRLLSSELAVDIEGVPEIVEEAMVALFKKRLEGEYGNGGWIEDIRSAGSDGNALGTGVVQVGLETDERSGFQQVSCTYHRPWYVVLDSNESNLLKSKFVCFVHHVGVDDAEELFPGKAEQWARIVRDSSSGSKRKVVRIYEYFDKADKKSAATRALILGSLDSNVYKVEANVFECLPMALCLGWTSPVQGRPFGRVLKEIAIEQAIHSAERRWQDDIENGAGAVIVDVKSLDENDVRRWNDGEKNVKIRQTNSITENPIKRVPSQELDANLLQYLQYQANSYSVESGLSELDRGVMQSRRTTATEVDYVQNISNANRGHEALQVTLFLRRLAELVFHIGRKFDRAPISIKLKGNPVKLNDPSVPDSWLDNIIGDNDYRVLVDTEALTSTDSRYKKAMELASLRELAPLVGQTIDPVQYTKKVLELVGEGEYQDWLLNAQPMAPQGQLPQQGGVPRVEDVARAGIRQDAA